VMNRIEIYGQSNSQLTQTLIQLATKQQKPEEQELQTKQQEQVCKLTTKYYEAELHIKYLDITAHPETNNPQAIVIQWGTQKKEHLAAILKPFLSSEAHSRLVIVDLDPESLEEDQEWHEICFQYGFECHSSSDLAEASMSWQCCPWPNIQPYSSSKSINKTNPLLIDQSPSTKPQIDPGLSDDLDGTDTPSPRLTRKPSQEPAGTTTHTGEELRFDDDFDDFVSAETSATQWDKAEEEEEEEDISAAEVEEMVSTLFGPDAPSSDAAPLGDLESLLGNLHRLKLQAASLDLPARHRLASRVALAVQSRLDPDH